MLSGSPLMTLSERLLLPRCWQLERRERDADRRFCRCVCTTDDLPSGLC